MDVPLHRKNIERCKLTIYNGKGYKYFYYMIQTEEDKKIVDHYKQTNISLRKQLNALNDEIDRLLVKKSNKIGLQKLPAVSKKITNVNVVQQQVETLRKRLQFLQKQNENYKEKVKINFHEKVRDTQELLNLKQAQIYQLKRVIKDFQRRDKIANSHSESKELVGNKIDQKISLLQEEITRNQKIERELLRQIDEQAAVEGRNNSHLKQLTAKKSKIKESSPKKDKSKEKEKSKQKQKEERKKKDKKEKKKKTIGEEDWKRLKKEFLMFKQSQQNEEIYLNEENERLRNETFEIKKKIKQKKNRIQKIQEHAIRQNERSRVHSTLEAPKQNKPYRYRDRHNSIQYNTKQ